MRRPDQLFRQLPASLRLSDVQAAGLMEPVTIPLIGDTGSPCVDYSLKPCAPLGTEESNQPPASLRTVVTKEVRGLDSMAESWRMLEPNSFGPMEQFEWSRACVERLAMLGRLRVFSVWENGRCRAIAPMVLNARRFFRLESMGVHELTEPMDFAYEDQAALESLCAALARQRSPINLPRVPETSAVPGALRRAFKGKAFVHVSRSSAYPVLQIDASWNDPEMHFNAGRRSDFRRALRCAKRFGSLQFDVLAPEPAELEGLLAEALHTELQSWKGRTGTALLLDSMRNKIYQHYLKAICQKGILRLAFMRIDGQAVGMQIIAETNQRLWLLKIGHNEAYSKCSPGTLLMLHVARYAAQRQLRSIEFLGSAESWTRMWTQEIRQCVQVRVYTFSMASVLALSYDVWRSVRTRILRGLKRAKS